MMEKLSRKIPFSDIKAAKQLIRIIYIFRRIECETAGWNKKAGVGKVTGFKVEKEVYRKTDFLELVAPGELVQMGLHAVFVAFSRFLEDRTESQAPGDIFQVHAIGCCLI
jgi:hypothetical protein